ncbi:MAG: hypothetical protein WC807_14800 [Hyphomicrobium sp.]|jgi:hypothetical protein
MTVSTQTDLSPEAYWKGVAERALAKHHDYEEALRISREQTSKILDVVWALHDCLKPFADIGIASNPDYAPSIRCDRDAILAARAAVDRAREI